MDELAGAVASLLASAAASSAGEAGKSAWEGLKDLVRTRFATSSQVALAVEHPQAASADEVRALFLRALADDPNFADAVRRWARQHRLLNDHSGDVRNEVKGDARVQGNIVQARDVGDIRF